MSEGCTWRAVDCKSTVWCIVVPIRASWRSGMVVLVRRYRSTTSLDERRNLSTGTCSAWSPSLRDWAIVVSLVCGVANLCHVLRCMRGVHRRRMVSGRVVAISIHVGRSLRVWDRGLGRQASEVIWNTGESRGLACSGEIRICHAQALQ